jgi:hypothetical protein
VVSDSASQLNEMISRLDESFLEIKDRIEGNSVELLAEKVDNSLNMLKELSESNSLDVFETVKECIDEIKNDIKYTVEEKSRTEIQEINVLIDGIKLILNDIEKCQSESSAEVITGVKAYVDEIKSEVFSDNADQVSEIVTKLDTSLLGIKDKIDSLANVELSEKVNASVELLKELSEKDIADDVSQKVRALLDSLKKDSETGLSDVISEIKTHIDDLKAEIKESIESAQKSDNFEINDLINQVKTTLSDIENYVGKSSSEIVAGIKTYIDEVRHEVVSDSNAQLDDIVSRFDSSLSEIKTQIESYPNELLLGKLDESLELLKQLSEVGADEELLEQINAIKEQMTTYSNSELLEKLDESMEAINKVSESSNDKELIEKIDASFLEIKTQLESYPSEVLIEKLDESLEVLKQLSEAGADEELLEQINAIKEQMATYSNSELLEKLEESLEAINKISELSNDKELIEKIDASFLEIKNQIDSYSNDEVIKKLDKSLEAIGKISEVKASQELIDKIDEIKSHIETYSNDEMIKKLDESIEAFKIVSEANVNEALIEKIDVLKTQIEKSSFDELIKKLDKSIDMLGVLSGSEANDELTDKIDESLDLMRKFSETSSPDVLAMLKDCIDDLKVEIKTYIDNKPVSHITVAQGEGEPVVVQDTQQIDNLVEDIKALLLDIEESMGTSSTEIVTGIKSCFDEMRNELKNEVVLLDSKIQSGISKIGGINTQKDLEELKVQVNSVVSELISQLITIFDNVSFDEESEDIKDFIYESSEGIRYDIQQIKHAVFGNNQEYDEESGIFEIVKKLEELSTIQNNNVESVLQILKNGVADEDNYTLTDVETDFAKIRLTLNDISSKSEEYKELSCKFGDTLENINKISSSLSNLDSINEDYVKTINNSFVDLKYDFQNIVQQFEKFNDDITNLSLCTNKLILKSEDSTNVLKDNLDSFRTMITQSEPDKIQTILSNMTFAMNDSVKLFDRKINELKKI